MSTIPQPILDTFQQRNKIEKNYIQLRKTKNNPLNHQNLPIRRHTTPPTTLKRHTTSHRKPTLQKRTLSTIHNTRHQPHTHPPNTTNMDKHLHINKNPSKPHTKKHHPNPPNHRRKHRRNIQPLQQPNTTRRHVLLRPNLNTHTQQKTLTSRKRLQPKLGKQ